jgi:hypothetical protein
MSLRTTYRWIALVLVETNVIYYLCGASFDLGGTQTSYNKGLMLDHDTPGDGEGGDLKIFGTAIFMVLNWTLGIKVLYESGSIIHGKWPAWTCRKDVGEGFWSRVGYSWYGLIYLSIAFNFFYLYTYQYIGTTGVSDFSPYVMVTYHLFQTRSIVWVVIAMSTIAAIGIDVIGKVFSNMFYPTQTQIHKEIQKLHFLPERRKSKKAARAGGVEMEI